MNQHQDLRNDSRPKPEAISRQKQALESTLAGSASPRNAKEAERFVEMADELHLLESSPNEYVSAQFAIRLLKTSLFDALEYPGSELKEAVLCDAAASKRGIRVIKQEIAKNLEYTEAICKAFGRRNIEEGYLVKVLKTHSHISVRGCAAEALPKTSLAAATLIEVLEKSDQGLNKFIRRNVARGLRDNSYATESILRLLNSQEISPSLAIMALRGHRRAKDVLKGYLSSTDPEQRYQAAVSIYSVDSSAAVTALSRLASNQTIDPQLQNKASKFLSELGPKRAFEDHNLVHLMKLNNPRKLKEQTNDIQSKEDAVRFLLSIVFDQSCDPEDRIDAALYLAKADGISPILFEFLQQRKLP